MIRLTTLSLCVVGVFGCRPRTEPVSQVLAADGASTAASVEYLSLGCAPGGDLNALASATTSVLESRNAHRLGGKSYVLQYFPPSALAESSDAAMLRLIPNDDFKPFASRDGRCRFDRKTALLFVYGVGNAGKGWTRESIPWALLDGLAAWNEATTYPRDPNSPQGDRDPDGDGHGKLASWPGYLQVIENTNPGPTERGGGAGASGYHSVRAMRSLVKSFKLAFAAGVEHLEVVTHSNGAITSQVAFNMFIDQHFTGAARTALLAKRAQKTSAPMTVKWYHLQAATRSLRRVYAGGDSPPGYYSDFVRVTKNESSWQTAHQAWNDASNRDLDAYLGNASVLEHFNFAFRHYYNDGDMWTYGTSGTGVGFYVSKYWFRIAREVSQPAAKLKVRHYACTGTWRNRCGPAHDNGHTALKEFVTGGGPGDRFVLSF